MAGSESLQKGKAKEPQKPSADALAQKKAAEEVETLKEKNEDMHQERAMRERYARGVLRYLFAYSLFVGSVLLLAGFKLWGFVLDDTILSYMVGSTAVAAIGLVLAIVQGLFKNL